MNILITGGAGFIGSHISERLIKIGHNIICIDNFNDFYDPKIKEDNLANIINNKRFKLFPIDILDKKKINKIFLENNIDLVIHLAARAGVRPSIANAELYEIVNVQGTINLLEECKRNNVNKFIFASSSSVYGGNKKTPFSENDQVDKPVSPYAMTKKSGERICYTYHYLYNIQVFAFRFFTVYGPRQRPEMAIHKFVREMMDGRDINIYGNGKSSRDYTYIDDIIDGITNSLDIISGYEIFNLGNSKPINIIELIKIIEDQTGLNANIVYAEKQPGDVFCTYSDISKAKRMINYNPKVSIEVGIKRFIEWYKSKNYKEINNDC